MDRRLRPTCACVEEASAGTRLPEALALLRDWTASGECLGAQLFVWRDERIVADVAVGRSGLARDASAGDVALLYCAVKPITVCCLARAVDAGEASFDDVVRRFLPEFSLGPRAAITLRQLLSHSSGLPSFFIRSVYEHEFDELVRIACTQQLAPHRWHHEPRYNPVDAWNVLAAVVERLYAIRFADVVTQAVCRPARLPTFCMTAPVPGRYVHCHTVRRGSFSILPEPPESVIFRKVNPAYGGFGSARDLGLLYAELVRCATGQGEMLSQECTREIIREHSVVELAMDAGQRTYGLGFRTNIRNDTIGGNWSSDSFGHPGGIGRNRVVHAFGDPQHRVAVAIRLFSVGAKNNWRFRRLGTAISADLGLDPVAAS